jgi:hypothetical protein
MALEIVPITFKEAKAHIKEHHRHHKPPVGMKVCIGVSNGSLRGVAVIGRPVARAEQAKGRCAEVTRTCTDGTPHTNSMLYGACRRIAQGMGYTRLITYTEEGESGASLRAASWIFEEELEPRANWHDSSKKLQHMRDPEGRGDVRRYRWRAW